MEAAGALSRAKNDQLKLAAWHETHLAVKPSLEMRESKARNLVLVILLETVSLRTLQWSWRHGRYHLCNHTKRDWMECKKWS